MGRLPSGDLVGIQLTAHVKAGMTGVKLTQQMMQQAAFRKAQDSAGQWDGEKVVGAKEGREPMKGVKLEIKQWRNPGRRSSGLRAWRSGDQADAWGSLRHIITSGAIEFRSLG